MNKSLVEAVAITAEITGTTLTKPAAIVFAQELEGYQEDLILAALQRCRRELKGRLTLSEVLSRIDDGRPGPDEVWGMLVWDEFQTTVMTTEMKEAQKAAWELYGHDKTGARLACKEVYISECQRNRAAKIPVQWEVSLGWDREGRLPVLKEAVKQGKISKEYARKFVPAPTIKEIAGANRMRELESMAKMLSDGDHTMKEARDENSNQNGDC